MATQPILLQNLRLLAHERCERPEEWPDLLAGVLGTTPAETTRILARTTPLTPDHVEQIATWSGRSPAELTHRDLLEERNPSWVFEENVRHLVRTDPRARKAMASALEVSGGTLSRWMNHKVNPPLSAAPRVAEAFGISDPELLKNTPFFLLDEPISVNQRRRWLHERIDAVPGRTLQRHFASIRKLLEDD